MVKKNIIVLLTIISVLLFLIAYQSDMVRDFYFKNFKFLNKIENPPVYEENVERLLEIDDLEDAHQKRQQLISFVWKSENRSENQPEQIIDSYNDSRFLNLENLENIQKIEIKLYSGVNSIAYHFIPKISNHKLIIYHQGHEGDFVLGGKTINYFLKNGYSVLALAMPLYGLNEKPIVDTEFGRIRLSSHKYFELLESPNFSPMIYFFEPINVSLNYLEKNFEYEEYDAIGISGGGWTVSVYSALDDRISKTFGVASSVPFFLRTTEDNFGDYEQTNSEFYRIADYLDIYVMSSIGENRKFVQIFNEYDPCCFYGEQFEEVYGHIIKSKLDKFGNGYFKIYLDDSTRKHEISDYALDVIESELRTNYDVNSANVSN